MADDLDERRAWRACCHDQLCGAACAKDLPEDCGAQWFLERLEDRRIDEAARAAPWSAGALWAAGAVWSPSTPWAVGARDRPARPSRRAGGDPRRL